MGWLIAGEGTGTVDSFVYGACRAFAKVYGSTYVIDEWGEDEVEDERAGHVEINDDYADGLKTLTVADLAKLLEENP